MKRVFATVRKVADYKTTVLLTGESGTGKEMIARALHQTSDRSDQAFVTVNCGAIPEQLLEGGLFDTSAAPSPTRIDQASSSKPTEGRSSSTRSATCRLRSR